MGVQPVFARWIVFLKRAEQTRLINAECGGGQVARQ
jgi:hypothetical protein